jgi:hypothetical protein
MQAFWAEYGFYLWALTTVLVIVALAWLGWNTFIGAPETEEVDEPEGNGAEEMSGLVAQVTELAEGAPLMRATLGRTLQFVGLERYNGPDGAQAFAVAVVNARGDGFVLSSHAGGLTAKPLNGWDADPTIPLSLEERAAIQQAHAQRDQKP